MLFVNCSLILTWSTSMKFAVTLNSFIFWIRLFAHVFVTGTSDVRLARLDMRGIFAGMVMSTQGLSYVYQFEGVPSEEDGIQLHVCQLCGKSYKSRSTLNRHLRYECGKARFKLECSVCGRKFSRPDNLRQHAGTHMQNYVGYKSSSSGGNFQATDNVWTMRCGKFGF